MGREKSVQREKKMTDYVSIWGYICIRDSIFRYISMKYIIFLVLRRERLLKLQYGLRHCLSTVGKSIFIRVMLFSLKPSDLAGQITQLVKRDTKECYKISAL